MFGLNEVKHTSKEEYDKKELITLEDDKCISGVTFPYVSYV